MSAPAPARLKLYRRLNGFLFPPGGTNNSTDALDGGPLRIVEEVGVAMRRRRIRMPEQRGQQWLEQTPSFFPSQLRG
jgi:hypothetical protein